MRTKHLLSLKDLSALEIKSLIDKSHKIKRNPSRYSERLKGKTLLMVFAKPSLRTHLSFDVAMHQLGGHSIFYSLENSTLGKKESFKDFSKVVSRYVDVVMARLYSHSDIEQIAKYSDVPVINGLTDSYHPCQILGDLLTIKEKFHNLKKIKIVFVGDARNNVTHSLIIVCQKLGIDFVVSAPNRKDFLPDADAIKGFKYKYESDPKKAVKNADVIYADSWMSYQIPESEKKKRFQVLKPYQVNKKLFDISPKAKFMHCLPAKRGDEVTDEVMDSSRSIIYDQAENRLHAQKAVLLELMKKSRQFTSKK